MKVIKVFTGSNNELERRVNDFLEYLYNKDIRQEVVETDHITFEKQYTTRAVDYSADRQVLDAGLEFHSIHPSGMAVVLTTHDPSAKKTLDRFRNYE